MTAKTALYRFFDAGDDLLYIGVAKNPFARSAQHGIVHPMHEVVLVEVEWFDIRDEALEAESIAIKRERPKWNELSKRKPRKRRQTFKPTQVKQPPTRERHNPGRPPKRRQPSESERKTICQMWHRPRTDEDPQGYDRQEVCNVASDFVGWTVQDYHIKHWCGDQRGKPKEQ